MPILVLILLIASDWARGGETALQPSRLLSQTGLYRDIRSGRLHERNKSFSPQYPLWSDGAQKSRWVFLPQGKTIDTTDPGSWKFPVGTKFWKEFSFSGRRIETRLIQRLDASNWIFATYLWNEDQTDAVLAPERGVKNHHTIAPGKTYSIPGRSDCRSCHENAGVQILGFNALQLSTDRDPNAIHGESFQPEMLNLKSLVEAGRLKPERQAWIDTPPKIPSQRPQTRTALGYFVANCAFCHHGDSEIASIGLFLDHSYDAREESVEPAFVTAIGKKSRTQIPGVEEAMRIKPGKPEQSSIMFRMGTRNPFRQMPPLGTQHVDQEAVEFLERWVREGL